MKSKTVNLNDLLVKELENNEFRLRFDQHRFYLQVAHLVSDLRSSVGISQAELAKKAGLSQPMLARLEKGDSTRVPTFETVYKVLKALGYTMSIDIRKQRKTRAA